MSAALIVASCAIFGTAAGFVGLIVIACIPANRYA